jgi:hypothetical protein
MTTWFLILCLFFPRLTLLFSWLTDNLPDNDTPFWADFFLTLFFPRFLVAYWASNLNVHVIWIILLVLLGVAELLGGHRRASSSK